MATVKGFEVGGQTLLYEDKQLANEFSTSKTYAVGDYVLYDGDGLLYKCHTAITTAGAWTGDTNWTHVVMGDETDDLKSAVSNIDNAIYVTPFVSSNLSLDSNGKIYMDGGLVNPSTGAVSSSTSGKYLRTQAGAGGANTFIKTDDKSLLVTLGLDWAVWDCWSYSNTSGGSATHSNTNRKWYAGTEAIHIPHNSVDKRICISVRRSDLEVITSEQTEAIKDAIKFYTVVDDTLSVAGAAADAKATTDAIDNTRNEGKAYENLEFLEVPCPQTDDGKWGLVTGGVYPSSGAAGGTGDYVTKYKRIQYGSTLYKIPYPDILITLGLRDYEWAIWTYNGVAWSDATRSLTNNAYQNCLVPVRLTAGTGDIRFCIAFRRVDLADWSDTDSTAINANFKMLRSASQSDKKILFLCDSITRGRIGGQDANTKFPIPVLVAQHLGIVCENFGIGNLGWCAGYTSSSPNKTNAFGYLKRVGDSDYYNWNDIFTGYKFLGSGSWDDFNTIIFALGVNDSNYTIGSLEDIDDTTSYADVMAWKTSAEDPATSDRTIVKAMYQAVRWIRESEANHSEGEPYVPGGKYKQIAIMDFMTGSRSTFRNNVCDLYDAFCKKYGVKHIKIEDAPIDPLHVTDYLPDSVHPNTSTYQLIARYIETKI